MYLQLAENNEICVAELSDNCGLPPLKPLRSRAKAPAKWAEYDRKKAEWDACREGKGKPTSIHPFNSVALAPGRALFLAMLDYNVDGLASRLATENISALSTQWGNMGGDPNKLVKFINQGKGKQRKQINFLEKFKGPTALAEDAPTEDNPAGLTNDQKAKIIAASTSVGVALAAAIPPIAPIAIPGGPILGTVLVGIIPFIKNAANKTPSAETAGANLPALPEPPPPPGSPADMSWWDKTNFTGFSNKQTVLVSGNIVGVTAAAVLYKRKKKKAAAVVLTATAVFDVAFYFINKST